MYGHEEIKIPKYPFHDSDSESYSSLVKRSPNSEVEVEQEIIPSYEAPVHFDGKNNKDCRPRLRCGSGTIYLLDSGSMCCVAPAEAGDTVDKSLKLQTVDGSPFDCYGKKQLTIKIGRKQYHIQAVKAKVRSPILGWDFVNKYKLDTVWNEFGDLYLRDKKAKIQKKLEHVIIPHKAVPRFEAVTMFTNIVYYLEKTTPCFKNRRI